MSTTSAPPVTTNAPAPRPVRELFTSPVLLGFLAVWAIALGYIFVADRSVLPESQQDVTAYSFGIAGGLISLVVLFWLARKTAPIDHRNGPAFNRAGMETTGLLAYMAIVLAIGSFFDIRTHIAFVALDEGSQRIWDQQTPTSLMVWMVYNFVALAALPYLFFRHALGYDNASMLLRFPRPAVWVPYFLVIGVAGFVFALTPEYTEVPLVAHLVTIVVFTLGSFLPVMITTQSLLTPRLAVISRSWVTGAVLSAFAYGALNITEAFLAWGSRDQILLSLAWFMMVSYWGLIKAVTTLRTGNAWLHIATTHTIHLAEAPAVATTLDIR